MAILELSPAKTKEIDQGDRSIRFLERCCKVWWKWKDSLAQDAGDKPSCCQSANMAFAYSVMFCSKEIKYSIDHTDYKDLSPVIYLLAVLFDIVLVLRIWVNPFKTRLSRTKIKAYSYEAGAIIRDEDRKRALNGLLTRCEVKVAAGYWPSSFFACSVEVHKLAKKREG